MSGNHPRTPEKITGGIPVIDGDKFRPNDYIIDKLYFKGLVSDIFELITDTPSVLAGLAVSQGTSSTITITSGTAIVRESQNDSVTDYDYDASAIGPISIPARYLFAAYAGVTNSAVTVTTDGVTKHYVKLANIETSVLQRHNASQAAILYDCIVLDGVALTVDTVAPISTDICLESFTAVAGPVFTFLGTDRTADAQHKIINNTFKVSGNPIIHNTTSGFTETLVLSNTANRTLTIPDRNHRLGAYDNYDTGIVYQIGDNVLYDENVYRCIVAGTTGAFDVTKWRYVSCTEEVGSITEDMTGFPTTANSALTFASNTVTIAPTGTSYDTYVKGRKRTISASVNTTVSTGGLYVYFNDSTDTLATASIPDLAKRLVAYSYYNPSSDIPFIIQGDERHSSARDIPWHRNHHLENGMTVPLGVTPSFTLTNNADTTIGLSSPFTAYDEDMAHTVTNGTPDGTYKQLINKSYPGTLPEYPKLFVDSGNYLRATFANGIAQPNTDAVLTTTLGGPIAYNPVVGGVGSIAAVPNNHRVNYWLIMTNCNKYPVKLVVGRNEWASLSEAQAEQFSDTYLPMPELYLIAQLIYRCDTGGTPQYYLEAVYRPERTLGTYSSFSAVDHNSTTNRDATDSHPATAISLATPGGMSATNVQTGIEELNSRTASLVTTKMSNAKVSLSGSALTFDVASGTIGSVNPIFISVPSTTAGSLISRILTSAITLTLPTSTVNTNIAGINTKDGSATYAVNGLPPGASAAVGIEWFLYYIYDPDGTRDLIGISKSPLHNVVPGSYFYNSTTTTISAAGSATTAWDAMITSATTALTTPGNCACVCLGSAFNADVTGDSITTANAGRFSSIAIQPGYIPNWNHKIPKVTSQIIATGLANAIGFGTTDTYIRKINPPSSNVGDKIQYFSAGGTLASGGVGGAEFYCTVDGYYNVVYTESIGTSGSVGGLSINSNQRTTGITSITTSNILSFNATGSSATGEFCSYSGYISAGSIIRPHISLLTANAYPQVFSITFNGFEMT